MPLSEKDKKFIENVYWCGPKIANWLGEVEELNSLEELAEYSPEELQHMVFEAINDKIAYNKHLIKSFENIIEAIMNSHSPT